jgi:hypothetical protein
MIEIYTPKNRQNPLSCNRKHTHLNGMEHNMKRIFIIAASLACSASPVSAQIYTCTQGDRQVYQSTPCRSGDQPVDLYVPPAAKQVQAHGRNEHVQQYLEAGREQRQRAEQIIDQRARNARESREQREKAEAEKQRISRAIFNNEVLIGMSAENVRDAWGRPDKINTSAYKRGVAREQWVYERKKGLREYVYLENGVVTGRN